MNPSPSAVATGGGPPTYPLAICLLTLVLTASPGCHRRQEAAAPPPPIVTVAHPASREVIEWDEYSGNLASPESVDVRARVSGEITSAPFKEGAIVQKDQLLFEIDVRPYQADLDAKKASAQQADAQVALARVTVRRYEQAAPGQAVSQQEYDTAKANLLQAEAVLAAAQAAVRLSQLNVEWCRVVAPIVGRVSRRIVTPGNLVTAGGTAAQGTLLTTINSLDPIYHYVTVDERSVLKYARLKAEGKRVSARDQPIPCFMELENEKGFPHQGYVDFVDNRVDPSTGTVLGRGVYANPDGALQPGFFARTRIPGSGRYRALLVPDAAIGTIQSLKFLLTVDANDVVESRPVKPGALFGTLRAIEEGITPSDRVIVAGAMKVRAGSKVDTRETAIDTSTIQLTAPGAAATQALPAMRPFGPTTTTAPATTRGTP
jgi:multidrug efflux system membrane fusion protein